MKSKILCFLNKFNYLLSILLLIVMPIFWGGYKDSYLDSYLLVFLVIDIIGIIEFILKPYKINKKIIIYLLFILTYLIPLFSNDIVYFDMHLKITAMIFLCFLFSVNVYHLFEGKIDKLNKIIIISASIITIISMLYVFMPDLFYRFHIQADYGDFLLSSIYRLYGTFMYPNSLALFCSIGILLGFKYIEKPLYKILIYINMLGLFLTISKSVLIFTLIMFIVIAIINKSVRNTLFSLFIPICLNLNLYRECVINADLIMLILFSTLFIFIYFILLTILERKKIIFIIINICIIGYSIVYPVRSLTIDYENNNDTFVVDLMGLEKGKYNISFTANGDYFDANIYLYKQFIIRNKMFFLTVGQKNIQKNNVMEFEVTDDAEYYSFKITNNGSKLKLNNLKVYNDDFSREVPLNYNLWPYNYAKSFEQLQYDADSVGGRFQIYKLCLDIIKDNPFLGHGYDYFKTVSIKDKELYHVLVEHSQIMTLGVQNGIFSIIMWIILIVIVGINSIRNFSKENIYQIFALFLLIITSFFDFSMSYHFFLTLLFIYSMLNLNNKKMDVLCISSGGGHLSAMKKIIENFDFNYDLITENDSQIKGAKYLIAGSRAFWPKYIFVIPINIILSVIYFIYENPRVIITTGSHSSIVMCFLGKIFRRKIIYVEVFARFKDLSLSGKIMYKYADIFIVQHKSLQKKYPKSIYIGGMF